MHKLTDRKLTCFAELQIKGKRNNSKPPHTADHVATQASEPSDFGANRNHQQSPDTAQSVHSAEQRPNGFHTNADTLHVDQSSEDPSKDSPHQSASRQESDPSRHDTAGQLSLDRASQQQAGHPQQRQSVASGHPQLQGLSSRRRSMERQSASLTLPFEQLNFVFHHINYSVPATVSLSQT